MRKRLAIFLCGFLASGAFATEVRVATFNIAMGLETAGGMAAALDSGDDPRLRKVASILQLVRPDIVLLNEFDYDPSVDGAGLLNANYLSRSPSGLQAIHYPYHFRAPSNTGIDSGLDLDGDGKTGGPGDAWGYGAFPGQYGMLVLSRFPLRKESVRIFRTFRWAAMPGALRPTLPDGGPFHPDDVWERLRLSSKSHWDLVFDIGGVDLHVLAAHPTPPVFDGPEDRNGRRNFDEIRFWRDYIDPRRADYIVDDTGNPGGLPGGQHFVIAGDLNADPHDGDAVAGAIDQLLQHERIDTSCLPVSDGARRASADQGGVNREQAGDPAADTADFNDRYAGNLRLDYVLPSRDLRIRGCGVFWPAPDESGHGLETVSDHHLTWVDITL
jgi:endonuclease/exonuclease/phosphatase family metal-dependent hydrolase